MKKSFILIQTANKHFYLYSFNKKQFIFVHPILAYLIQNRHSNAIYCFDENRASIESLNLQNHDTIYWEQEYNILERNGYFTTINEQATNKGKLTSHSIHEFLSNTNQITFELTSNCNLNCEYCGFGEYYSNSIIRNKGDISFSVIEKFISYMVKKWNSPANSSLNKEVAIGFYGGEPLLKFETIRKTVELIGKISPINCSFLFVLTTNGVLLEKYIDYFVKHNFFLTISLDGNKRHNIYRKFKNGRDSFEIVRNNLHLIKKKYPSYFSSNIKLNSVLHDKNSFQETRDFCFREFKKYPIISQLSLDGVATDLRRNFLEKYQSIEFSFDKIKDLQIAQEDTDLILNIVNTFGVFDIIYHYSGYTFERYKNLLENNLPQQYFHTGTCPPFSKSIFIDVDGNVFPCEKVSRTATLGKISDFKVDIPFRKIADKYNLLNENIQTSCKECYTMLSCKRCLLRDNFYNTSGNCDYFSDLHKFAMNLQIAITILEYLPVLYKSTISNIFAK